MRRLVVAVVVVLVVLVAGDLVARFLVEARLASRVEARAGTGSEADAGIHSFPFVPRAVLGGKAGAVEVSIRGFRAGPLRVAAVDLDLRDVRVDQARLRRGEVRVTRVRHVTVAAEITAQDLADALGLPLTIGDGEVGVTVAGRRIGVRPRVGVDGSLSFPGLAVVTEALALDRVGVVGCSDVSIRVRGDRLEVGCRTREIPPVLLGAAQVR